MIRFLCAIKPLIVLFLLLNCLPLYAQEKEIVGYLEKVRIYPEDVLIHVKLDTGADISSLNAEDIVEYTKKGQKWVKFTVRNRYGEQIRLEREIKRITHIKQHDGKSQKRYVVRLAICLGTAYMEEEVSLVNRSQFSSQMLVGRSYQAGNVVVDAAQTYLTEPSCQSFIARKEKKESKVKEEEKEKEVVVVVETPKQKVVETPIPVEEVVIEEEKK